MSVFESIKGMETPLSAEIEKELKLVKDMLGNVTRTKYAGIRAVIEDVMDLNGKMLRPIFVILSGHFGAYRSEKAVQLAASIELLHLATLIHDDIVDDSKMRRHKESVQSKYGKDMAVYAGDYLLAKSLTILDSDKYEAKHVDRLAEGIERICESELLQYQSRFNTMTVKNYLRIVSGKTATLFAVALYVGAAESGCSEQLSKQLGRIGHELGIAFQIIDDVLDFSTTQKNVGKSTQNDLKKGYYTLPVIYALRESDDVNPKSLESGIQKSRKLAIKYTDKAFKRIEKLPDSEAKDLLQHIATHMLKRQY
ncbi:polyprenyl synthetase family protein [Fusibacter tunisiensis]|uniref:Heptaprenyl diphosphate synthase n=1 Tax=Fusibacter tunisiensis TaxID=1008308 RepID=A0ABS2MSJ2_9FIRM|nr:polyprenyl synthetase family protein [Fusibacter tunisiensis]MBM7562369.1 heptaprenyl diphosphate synthase [Fusibacter tunisiensis]